MNFARGCASSRAIWSGGQPRPQPEAHPPGGAEPGRDRSCLRFKSPPGGQTGNRGRLGFRSEESAVHTRGVTPMGDTNRDTGGGQPHGVHKQGHGREHPRGGQKQGQRRGHPRGGHKQTRRGHPRGGYTQRPPHPRGAPAASPSRALIGRRHGAAPLIGRLSARPPPANGRAAPPTAPRAAANGSAPSPPRRGGRSQWAGGGAARAAFRGKKDLARKGARGRRAEQSCGGRGAEPSRAQPELERSGPAPAMGRAPVRALPAAPPAAPAAPAAM